MSSLFRRKLDELEDMFINSQDDLLARFSSTYEENARLKAEVERLIKAGDALGSALILFELKSEEERQERLKNWAIAKYGEPRNG